MFVHLAMGLRGMPLEYTAEPDSEVVWKVCKNQVRRMCEETAERLRLTMTAHHKYPLHFIQRPRHSPHSLGRHDLHSARLDTRVMPGSDPDQGVKA
jgi:hypothetical protein